MQFREFKKIPRLNRDIVITEKLDGTNAQIYIESNILVDAPIIEYLDVNKFLIARNETHSMFAGSRTRWIIPGDDNYGFANWVKENSEELFKLGEGQHFGEYWGKGIQRNYGLPYKKFSLFNVGKWVKYNPENKFPLIKGQEFCPDCCDVVPILYQGIFNTNEINDSIDDLKRNGSQAVPGYLSPEGIIIYHTASKQMFKVTCESDEKPKGNKE